MKTSALVSSFAAVVIAVGAGSQGTSAQPAHTPVLSAAALQAKSQELAGRVGMLGHLKNANGEIEAPLTIKGTTMAPKTSLDLGSLNKKQLQNELQKGLQKLFK